MKNKYSKINVKELENKIAELKEKLKQTFIKKFYGGTFEVIIDNNLNYFCFIIEKNEIKFKESIKFKYWESELVDAKLEILEDKLVNYNKINFAINELIRRVSFLDADYKENKEQDALIKRLLIENEKLKKDNNELKNELKKEVINKLINDFEKVSFTSLFDELKETCIYLEEKIKKFECLENKTI